MTEEKQIEEAVREAAQDGRIACRNALDIADRLDVEGRLVGKTIDSMGIKIVRCQLGCFGWKRKSGGDNE
ncbi:MAG: hypothetical protein ACLFWL_00745 [Candidatus Brocadiia bacterium]